MNRSSSKSSSNNKRNIRNSPNKRKKWSEIQTFLFISLALMGILVIVSIFLKPLSKKYSYTQVDQISAQTNGKTIVVNQGGSINSAIQQASSGDTILVKKGVYHEWLLIEKPNIKIIGEGRPLIDGQYNLPSHDSGDNCGWFPFSWDALVDIQADNVTFQGFEVRNSMGRGVQTLGGHNAIIEDNIIIGARQSGLNVERANNAKVIGNVVGDSANFYPRNRLKTDRPDHDNACAWPGGLAIVNGSDGALVERNTVYNTWGEGVIAMVVPNATFRNNVIYDNYACEFYGDRAPNLQVIGNIIYHTNPTYERENGSSFGIALSNESDWRPHTTGYDQYIAYNLIAGASQGLAIWDTGSGTLYRNTVINSTKVGIQYGGNNEYNLSRNLVLHTNGKPLSNTDNVRGVPLTQDNILSTSASALKMPMNQEFAPGKITCEYFRVEPGSPAIDYGGYPQACFPTTVVPSASPTSTPTNSPKPTPTPQTPKPATPTPSVRPTNSPTPVPPTSQPSALQVPGRIEAEYFNNSGNNVGYYDATVGNIGGAYLSSTDVDMERTSDTTGGVYNIGWTSAGEWLTYNFVAAEAGTYQIESRVTNYQEGAEFDILIDGTTIGKQTIPGTGDWQDFKTVASSKFNLSSGNHTMRINISNQSSDGAAGNFNYFDFIKIANTPTPQPANALQVPGRIEAEFFNNTGNNVGYYDTTSNNIGGAYISDTAVDMERTTDTNGGNYNIGWTKAGEWLTYTFTVNNPGAYRIDSRVANLQAGAQFDILIDGNSIGSQSVPGTGNWQSFSTISSNSFNLTSGTHTMRINITTQSSDGAAGNFNYFEFTKLAGSSPTLVKAININGPALTIDGVQFQTESQAGVTATGTRFANQAVGLIPSVSGPKAEMIRTSLWGGCCKEGPTVKVANLPSAKYNIYTYIWEDTTTQTFDLYLENQVQQAKISSGKKGEWKKLGPYAISISDGSLDIWFKGGDANLSGIEIWK